MNPKEGQSLTPRKVVEELDRYIVGQDRAKRSVAIALRNRWRRQNVDGPLRDEISPKNIIMVGATGVGKTEIARRLAKLSGAPFVKVEVSKFTEVGYVGRDVDSVVRDLVEVGVGIVREDLAQEVANEAKESAESLILDLLLPPSSSPNFGYTDRAASDANDASREKMRSMLNSGQLDDREIEIEVEDESSTNSIHMFPGAPQGEQIGQQIKDILGQLGKRKVKRKVRVSEARKILGKQESDKLVDREKLHSEAVSRTEQLGVVFLDEIDKICGRDRNNGVDVSREGVQRDLLPLVEGTTVSTKYGPVRTDHILFIAAGAFHMAKVSDLMPELQGRFPIRVELDSLTTKDFVKILRDTENSLLKQYHALMATEEVQLNFDEEAIVALAEVASQANAMLENIGARRLHTVLERVLDELSFEASEIAGQEVKVTAQYVKQRLGGLLDDQDLSRHIL